MVFEFEMATPCNLVGVKTCEVLWKHFRDLVQQKKMNSHHTLDMVDVRFAFKVWAKTFAEVGQGQQCTACVLKETGVVDPTREEPGVMDDGLGMLGDSWPDVVEREVFLYKDGLSQAMDCLVQCAELDSTLFWDLFEVLVITRTPVCELCCMGNLDRVAVCFQKCVPVLPEDMGTRLVVDLVRNLPLHDLVSIASLSFRGSGWLWTRHMPWAHPRWRC